MEEYDDTYYAPQITSQGETRTLTFQTRILNQHLICTLCMGYFDEACTIIEFCCQAPRPQLPAISLTNSSNEPPGPGTTTRPVLQ